MHIGVLRETAAGERRVAVTPAVVTSFAKQKTQQKSQQASQQNSQGNSQPSPVQVLAEAGCGLAAGFSDDAYVKAGATIVGRDELFARSEVVCGVRLGAANPGFAGGGDLARMRPGQVVLGLCDCLAPEAAEVNRALADTGVTVFALELVPRITRAQSMDVLSSQATISGYKAVLLAASSLPRLVPMFTTAAGTIKAAKALVLGAGVAGLQAIATLRRLGAIVSAYDVRPAVKEQIESLGGRFVDLASFGGPTASGAEDKGGYAKAQDEEFYRLQRSALARVCAEQDIVISTAAVPGRRSPLLITAAAVESMGAGSVIVDLAAERGGNCELSRADAEVVHHGVRILAPTNLPSTVPIDASQMFARNILAFLTPVIARSGDGAPDIDLEDEVLRDARLAADGAVVAQRASGWAAGGAAVAA